MRRGHRRTIPADRAAARGPAMLALALLLAGCAGVQGLARPDLATVAARMPAEMAGFLRGESERRPGPSLAMDYATANRRAVGSILVYETPAGAAPDDPAAAEIDREVTHAVIEVAEAPHGRTGRRLTERERLTLSEAGLRCAVLRGAFGRAPVMRHLCVGGAQGRFVKIQVTMGDTEPPPADAVAFATAALRAVRGG
jgi:hypothetical protein